MPEIDTVEFKIMTDSNAVLMALKSGDLDIASVDARNFSSLGKDFTSVEGPQNMVQIFALNNSVEPLNKKEDYPDSHGRTRNTVGKFSESKYEELL